MQKIALYLVLAVSMTTLAQSPRFALSTHVTSMDTGERIPGVGATFTYSFTRRFALDSTLNFFPGNPRNNLGRPELASIPLLSTGGWRSGNVLQGQFGVRAVILKTKKVDVFLTTKPGFVSFSRLSFRAPYGINPALGDTTADVGRQTYFAPFFGAGVQLYPSPKTFVRLDCGATVVRYGGFTTTLTIPGSAPGTQPIMSPQPSTTHTFQFSTGFGFRFGRTR